MKTSRLFLVALVAAVGASEIWTSDGTSAGTVRILTDINPGGGTVFNSANLAAANYQNAGIANAITGLAGVAGSVDWSKLGGSKGGLSNNSTAYPYIQPTTANTGTINYS